MNFRNIFAIFLFGLLLTSVFAFDDEVDASQWNWYNDTTLNDSCVTIYSDSSSYVYREGFPVAGYLKIENSCGQDFSNKELFFSGVDSKLINVSVLREVEKDLSVKKQVFLYKFVY